MNEKVKKYLEKKHSEDRAKKEELLFHLGLYEEGEREYTDQPNSPDYPYWDNETHKFYKVHRIFNVSDEEYEEILSYEKSEPNKEDTVVAKLLTILGCVLVFLGIIVGAYVGSKTTATTGWIVAISSVVSGLLIIAFGQALETLIMILNKMNGLK